MFSPITVFSDFQPLLRLQFDCATKKDQAKDGVLTFSVNRDGSVGLAASWAYDGNLGGGWKAERKTKEDLVASGWREVGHMYLNQFDRHTIFIRECKKGESFRIRTRKYNRPLVLVPDVLEKMPKPMAKVDPSVVVEVAASESKPVDELLPREDIPEALDETTAFISPLRGVAIVKAHRRCVMYVAASWNHDGNTSGQWTEERWSKERFFEEGWEEVDTLAIKHRGSDQQHTLFTKECDKGDHFRFRTRKYGAPYVFVRPSE